jgi:hypothetical protein
MKIKGWSAMLLSEFGVISDDGSVAVVSRRAGERLLRCRFGPAAVLIGRIGRARGHGVVVVDVGEGR